LAEAYSRRLSAILKNFSQITQTGKEMCVSKMFHSLALGRDLLTASAAVYKSLALGLTTRPKFRKMG